jgi:ABC-type bacteriocin/lantibiotic exporter with double-glycine peptidase domain
VTSLCDILILCVGVHCISTSQVTVGEFVAFRGQLFLFTSGIQTFLSVMHMSLAY